jgi:hypothetical protein
MKRLIACVSLAAAFAILTPSRAHAVPIGVFSWFSECEALVGPCFQIDNFSADELFSLPTIGLAGQSFMNVLVHIVSDPVHDPFTIGTIPSESDGVIPPGLSAQTTADLTGIVTTLASLTLDFALPGLIALIDGETGAVLEGLTSPDTSATIEFTPAAQPVPEPGTLLLVASAATVLAFRRARRRAR